MAGSVNKVILVGNLGGDPEIRSTQDGKEIANFSIATSEQWKDKMTGEKKVKTEWHRVVVFQQGLVNVIKQYVKKGAKIYLEGSLQTRKWTDNNGMERYSTEIVLQGFNSVFTMLDNAGGQDSNFAPASNGQNNNNNSSFSTEAQSSQNNNSNNSNNNSAIPEDFDDEIPF